MRNFFEAIILGIASFEEPGVVKCFFRWWFMRGMGSRSARHTLIAVTGLVFCTLAPLITVLCFINGSLAAQVLVVNSDSPHSWEPQTNGRPSEVLCSDLRFGTAECGKRQKPWCGSVEAKETLWTYFQLTTVRCRYLYSYLFAARIDLLFFVLGAFLVRKWEKKQIADPYALSAYESVLITERAILFQCFFK